MGGCFLHRQEIPPQEKQLLTHHALKKTSKHLHDAAAFKIFWRKSLQGFGRSCYQS